ncbi:MAG: DUF4238 domain-containing protein [Bacteroidales bacterium]|nr:DUF4238 domain-containing protein [Bacteroidales bacterium]
MTGTNQHFVPLYYLKTFANSKGLYVYDKNENRFLSENRIPVNKIGFSKNFYDIEPEYLSRFIQAEISDESFVDSLLEEYNERISAPLINSFIEFGEMVYRIKKLNIASIIRPNDVIDFLVVQLFRTPFFRKQFEFIARDLYKKHHDKPDLLKRYSIEDIARTIHGVYIICAICNTDIWKNQENDSLIKSMFRFIEFEVIDKFEQLKAMSKTLWVSAVDNCYITSDNPIVISQSDSGKIELLFFPITKRCSITYSFLEQANKSVITINEKRKKVLLEQNRIMKDWANRFIYSYNKTDISNRQ